MGPLGQLKLLIVSSLFLFSALSAGSGFHGLGPADVSPPANLYLQSLIRALDLDSTQSGNSYLLLDSNSGALLASRWENYETPISLGSLVKPFTALAYAETHDFVFPRYQCQGLASGCWQVRSHGLLDIVAAISASCNSYFRLLAGNVTTSQLLSVTREFGLEPPGANFTASSLVGLGEEWKISPMRMVRAYAELYQRRSQPGVREVIEGMSRSARYGTGAAVGREIKYSEVLVKTGTTPCMHGTQNSTDGFAVLLLPAHHSAIVLLIRVHGVAGASAAEVAAHALSQNAE
jgi:cell division protein FtsI/penicillin-binding protein 2